MNDLSGSSIFPTETGLVDSVERESPRAGTSQAIKGWLDLKLLHWYESPVSDNAVTYVGAPVACRPHIIDTVVATLLLISHHFKVYFQWSRPMSISTKMNWLTLLQRRG
ncbi:hypothetical protein TNCV_4442691 [Trichonephila clavipes]|nr:hypothetical protein TNCV_4442691 [Trichonephila clavipes]